MSLSYVLLCCVGLTYILKYGAILSWLRRPLTKISFFKELFGCSLCLGFWSGGIMALGLYFLEWKTDFLLLPLSSAAVSWVGDSIIRVIQTQEMVLDKKLENK